MVYDSLRTASKVSTVVTLAGMVLCTWLFPEWDLPLWEKGLWILIVSYGAAFAVSYLRRRAKARRGDDEKEKS